MNNFFIICLIFMSLIGCVKNDSKPIVYDEFKNDVFANEYKKKGKSNDIVDDTNSNDLDFDFNKYSKKDKARSLICSGIVGTCYDKKMEDYLKQTKPGSIILFKRNIIYKEQLIELIANIRSLYDNMNMLQPFIFVDEEGGRVDRLKSVSGPTKSPSWYFNNSTAKEYGLRISKILNDFDINSGFSPVLDTQKPNNGIIGDRSFSGDYNNVATFGREVIMMMKNENILSVAKHFPGHGATNVDSHAALPVIKKSIEELERTDLVPFIKNLDIVDGVMIGHILIPSYSKLPASISPEWIKYLRDKFNFDGLIISDDLTMRALDNYGDLKNRVITFINSGGDIPLICHNMTQIPEIIDAILKLDDDLIDTAFDRIVKYKLKLNFMKK